jgi:hypothetical protein
LPERAREVTHLRRVCAEMASNADYANARDLRSTGPIDRGEVRWRLLDALQHAFELGQLLALPTLVELVRVRDDHDAGLPISSDASWLQIGPAWPVLDRSGVNLGLVHRVRGNRQTGEFEGIDVDTSPARRSTFRRQSLRSAPVRSGCPRTGRSSKAFHPLRSNTPADSKPRRSTRRTTSPTENFERGTTCVRFVS